MSSQYFNNSTMIIYIKTNNVMPRKLSRKLMWNIPYKSAGFGRKNVGRSRGNHQSMFRKHQANKYVNLSGGNIVDGSAEGNYFGEKLKPKFNVF